MMTKHKLQRSLEELTKLSQREKEILLVTSFKLLAETDAVLAKQIPSMDSLIKKYGNAETALKEFIYPWFYLLTAIESDNFANPIKPFPEVAMTVVDLLRKKWNQISPIVEANIALKVEERLAIVETRYAGQIRTIEDARTKAEKAFKDVEKKYSHDMGVWKINLDNALSERDTAQRDLKTANQNIATQGRQIQIIRGEYDKTKQSLDATLQDNKTKSDRIAELENEKDALDREIRNLAENLRNAVLMKDNAVAARDRMSADLTKTVDMYQKAENELKLTNAALKKEKRLGKISWLGFAAASLTAAILYFSPGRTPQQPRPEVPIEQLTYSDHRAMVRFGEETYEMTLGKLSEVYTEIKKDEKKTGKTFSPAERKAYFDKKAKNHYVTNKN